MITGLNGSVSRFGAARVYLNCGPFEYEVHVPLSVQARLKADASEVSLHIYHHFTDSEQRLYGFLDLTTRDFFVALQGIKGMGTALALSLLSHLEGAALLDVCARKDVAVLTRIPRIGKTTAETIVFEINRRRERFAKLIRVEPGEEETPELTEESELAHQALIQLGYKEKEARQALAALRDEWTEKGEDPLTIPAAEWIAAALRRF